MCVCVCVCKPGECISKMSKASSEKRSQKCDSGLPGGGCHGEAMLSNKRWAPVSQTDGLWGDTSPTELTLFLSPLSIFLTVVLWIINSLAFCVLFIDLKILLRHPASLFDLFKFFLLSSFHDLSSFYPPLTAIPITLGWHNHEKSYYSETPILSI